MTELLAPPRPVRVRLDGPAEVTRLVKNGDRDAPYNDGAATVVDVGKDEESQMTIFAGVRREW